MGFGMLLRDPNYEDMTSMLLDRWLEVDSLEFINGLNPLHFSEQNEGSRGVGRAHIDAHK